MKILSSLVIVVVIIAFSSVARPSESSPIFANLRKERAVLYESYRRGIESEYRTALYSMTPLPGMTADYFFIQEMVFSTFHARDRFDFNTVKTAGFEAARFLTRQNLEKLDRTEEKIAAYALAGRFFETIAANDAVALEMWTRVVELSPRDDQALRSVFRIKERRYINDRQIEENLKGAAAR